MPRSLMKSPGAPRPAAMRRNPSGGRNGRTPAHQSAPLPLCRNDAQAGRGARQIERASAGLRVLPAAGLTGPTPHVPIHPRNPIDPEAIHPRITHMSDEQILRYGSSGSIDGAAIGTVETCVCSRRKRERNGDDGIQAERRHAE